MKQIVSIFSIAVSIAAMSAPGYADISWVSSDTATGPLDWDSAPPELRPSPMGGPFETWSAEATYSEVSGLIEIIYHTNIAPGGYGPGSGTPIRDSYGDTDTYTLNVADIYLGVATGNHWTPEEIYAIAMESHSGNVVEQAYDGSGPWMSVVQGGIYSTANNALTDFATGTYEAYESAVSGWPADAGNGIAEIGLKPIYYLADQGFDNYNTYPTLLREYNEQLGLATIEWLPGTSAALWEVHVTFDPTLLGLSPGDLGNLHIFWGGSECGNDGVLLTGATHVVVPEPAAVTLIFGAALSIGAFRRRAK